MARQLNIKVDEDVMDRLQHLADATGRTRTFYALEFIQRGLNDLEDHYLLKDALEEYYASDEAAIPHADMDWDALGR